VPAQIVFAVSIAWVLTRPKRGVGVYRTIFFLPYMVPLVAASLGFVFLLNPSGPVNRILGLLHLPQPLWFQDPRFSKPALVLLSLWAVGDLMIIFLAGLLDVPAHLYEAADIEGASGWQKFRHITLPTISPVMFFAVLIGVIGGLQYFTQGYIASAATSTGNQLGDPQGSLLFYTIWLYQQGFSSFHMGYAAALAWVLFLATLGCTVLLIKGSNRWVHYQGGPR
jgi:multiple sugar transport system permease protein